MDRSFFIFFVICLSVLVILFFPIYLDTNAHYDMGGRKFSFSINAYKLIKLIGGYIATYTGGLAAHISPKKAILIPYSDLDNERKRFSILKSFRLKTLTVTAETGAEYLLPVYLLQNVAQVFFLATGGKREELESNLWLRDGDILRISLNFTVRFNLYILLHNFLKYLKEKIKVLCQTKIKGSTI